MKLVTLLLCSFISISAAPLISGHVKNAASNQTLMAAGGGLAQGSYIAISGTGLGPDSAAVADITKAPSSTTLGGASVTITPAGGTPVQAFLTFVQATQINAILPSSTPAGDATVTVTYNNATSPAERIRV